MKKQTIIFIALGIIVSLISTPSLNAEKVFKIGIFQIVSHPALDANRKGFIDGMAEAGYKEGKNVNYDIQNAHGDISTCNTIAQKFVRGKVDMIVAIATPNAQAAAKATQTIPIILGTLTDPVAAGIAKSWESSGRNVTGVASKAPMDKTVDLFLEVYPKLKKLGVLYNPGEKNSVDEVKELEKVANQKGLKLIHAPVATSADVMIATQSLVGRVDAITTPKDNTVVSGLEGGLKVAQKAKIPFFAMDVATVKRGAVAALGVDFYELGKNASKKAVRVLEGEKPENIPISMAEKFFIWINLKAANDFGLTISEEVLNKADHVIK
jgi:putative ABC transport system substrate-binding protein